MTPISNRKPPRSRELEMKGRAAQECLPLNVPLQQVGKSASQFRIPEFEPFILQSPSTPVLVIQLAFEPLAEEYA